MQDQDIVWPEIPPLDQTRGATLQRWRKRDGETVMAGEVIAQVKTDDAIVEMVAEATGIL
jgi:pyruvate/2-oxoglutarate dehydrogenase complex dihydrolipoamide acyltransferase (E2) component